MEEICGGGVIIGGYEGAYVLTAINLYENKDDLAFRVGDEVFLFIWSTNRP